MNEMVIHPLLDTRRLIALRIAIFPVLFPTTKPASVLQISLWTVKLVRA